MSLILSIEDYQCHHHDEESKFSLHKGETGPKVMLAPNISPGQGISESSSNHRGGARA